MSILLVVCMCVCAHVPPAQVCLNNVWHIDGAYYLAMEFVPVGIDCCIYIHLFV